MAVHDVRAEVEVHQRVDDRAGEEAEALVLVAAEAVDVGAAEVVVVVHEVERDALIHEGLDAAVLLAPAQLHLKLALELHVLGVLLRDGGVERQDDAHVVAALLEHRGERADHVGQTAGLDERDALGSCKQDLHVGVPPSSKMT